MHACTFDGAERASPYLLDMSCATKPDDSQMLSFPESVEDRVPAEHPARFIRDSVDALDLEALGFEVREAPQGRPNHSANLLLKSR
jgi:hypothetical protein